MPCCCLQERENGFAILGRDIDEEDVRHAGRRGAIHLRDDAALDQIDGEGEHHADPERH